MQIKKYFNLRHHPFKNTTDPDFCYLTESAQKAYRCMTDAIYQQISYVVLSGDPGTGKTMLLKRLMTDNTLPARWIFFNHASLDWEEILLAMGRALKISGSSNDPRYVAQKIAVRLKQSVDQATSPVLIIDEAQRLTNTTLLSLFEWHTDLKAQGIHLTVILSGQTNFTRALIDSNLSRFTANVTVHCRLEKLTPSECRAMIAYRLDTAGYSGPPLFNKKTLKVIIELSGGNPRVLNRICDYAVFQAVTHARRKVSCEDIRQMSPHLDPKIEAPHSSATIPIKGAGFTADIARFLKGIFSGLWANSAGWRSYFSPLRCGILGLIIMLAGGSVWFRTLTASPPIQSLSLDSHSIGRIPIQRFKINTVAMHSAVMPVQKDTLFDHSTADREKIKPDIIDPIIEPVIATTGDFDLSGSLARVDPATPERGGEIAKAMETALRQQQIPDTKYQPEIKPKRGIKNRLVIARIHPVGPVLTPPAKSSPLVSISLPLPEKTEVAAKNLKRDRSPALPQPATSPSKKADPDPNILLTAIQKGDLDTIRGSLSNGTDPNTIFSETETALTVAVDRGQIETINLLLDQGATINQPTPSGETALMKSAWAGHEVITDLLLKRGAQVNTQNREGWTPLFYGSVMGRGGIVKKLVEYGARLDLTDQDGRSPLMAAAWNGHAEVVRYLLAQGASPNTKDRDGWTPLMFAAFEGHTEVVQVLISRGANLWQKNNRGQSSAVLATNRGHAELYAMISTIASR